MRKINRIVAIILGLCLSIGAFAACNDVGGSEDAAYFVVLVEDLEQDGMGLITLDELDFVQDFYDSLSDKDKNSEPVKAAFEKLDNLYAEFAVYQASKDFFNKAALVPEANSVSLNDLAKINAALAAYAPLSADIKDTQSVKAAYAKLTVAKDAYDVLLESEGHITQFTSAVSAITSITFNSKVTLDAALAIFNGLSTKEKGDSRVVSAKSQLDSKFSEYNQIKQKADEFINASNALDGETQYTTAQLNEVLAKYNVLHESAKENELVMQAKEHLDAEITRMSPINAQADAQAFIALTVGLPTSFEATTLEDAEAIQAAAESYEALTEAAREEDGVEDALAVVLAAFEFFTDLASAHDFIALANALPANIKDTDLGKIVAAEEAYEALSERAKTVEGVEAANEKVIEAREKYGVLPSESLPEFFGLEIQDIVIAPDGGLAWGDPMGQLETLKKLYGNASMTHAQLLEKVDFVVHFYASTATESSQPVCSYVLQDQGTELWILTRARMKEILTAADVANGSYKMAMTAVDKTGLFGDSSFSGFTPQTYAFSK